MKRRRLRRYGGVLAALCAMVAGLVPEDAQIATWVVFTLATSVVHALSLISAHRTVIAVKSHMRVGSLTVYDLAELAAELINAENHRSREFYRLLAVIAMLAIGVAAILQVSGLIAPLLFFIVAVTLLNSAIDQLERKELKEALRQEVQLAKEEGR